MRFSSQSLSIALFYLVISDAENLHIFIQREQLHSLLLSYLKFKTSNVAILNLKLDLICNEILRDVVFNDLHLKKFR